MKKTIWIILAVVLQGPAAEQRPTESEEEPLKPVGDKFMKEITSGKTAEALDGLLDNYWYDRSGLAKFKMETKGRTEAELTKVEASLGKGQPDGYEFLGVKRLGKRVVGFVYLQKFENFVEPWALTYYESSGTFRLAGLQFGQAAQDVVRYFSVAEPARLQVPATDERPNGRNEARLKEAADKFLTNVSNGRMAEALDALLDRYWYDQSGLTRSKVLIESQFNAELAKAEITVGKRLPNAHEFLGAKRLGKCVIRLVYLQHFENFCSGWALTFYKARHEFKLISLNFGDSVEDDLKTFTTTEPTP